MVNIEEAHLVTEVPPALERVAVPASTQAIFPEAHYPACGGLRVLLNSRFVIEAFMQTKLLVGNLPCAIF